MYLNGVILVSMTGLSYDSGTDTKYVTSLPYMTAAAWYHKKLPQDLQSQPLAAAITEAEKYAAGDYQLALFKGGLITPQERTTVAQHVARLIGVLRISCSAATCAWRNSASGRSCSAIAA
jgi:hypothetical protein